MSDDKDVEYCDPVSGAILRQEEGGYRNPETNVLYPVKNGIPRFIPNNSYADNFADQWRVFQNTQLDEINKTSLSKDRFFSGTEWDRSELCGRKVLELGCGAGRFTKVMLDAGAYVWATDISEAVDVCLSNCKNNPNLNVVQADVFRLPFKKESFDYVFMYGVMQHTPCPEEALKLAISMANRGGKIAIDSYVKMASCRWTSKYLWRWLTTRMDPLILRKFISWYVPKFLPIDNALSWRMPRFHKLLVSIIPCWNYTGIFSLSDRQIKEWAILDTYDALGAKYDKPLSRIEMNQILKTIPSIGYTIKRGGNGLEVNIQKIG